MSLGDPAENLLNEEFGVQYSTIAQMVSGTPVANPSALHWSTFYVNITGGTAGTIGIKVGTAPPANVVVPVTAANAVASQCIPVRVPPGASITVTVTVATIDANTLVVTE